VVAAERITEALAAGAAYRIVVETWTGADDRATVLAAIVNVEGPAERNNRQGP